MHARTHQERYTQLMNTNMKKLSLDLHRYDTDEIAPPGQNLETHVPAGGLGGDSVDLELLRGLSSALRDPGISRYGAGPRRPAGGSLEQHSGVFQPGEEQGAA